MGGMSEALTSRRGIYTAEVVANIDICRVHHRLRMRMEAFPATRPGQFVQLQCRFLEPQVSGREVEWSPDRTPRLTQPELTNREPFLRRPFSLAGRRDTPEGVELDIIYRTVGAGTGWLTGVTAGEELSLLGPLGNAFLIEDRPLAAVVGGGVGIPPLVYLAEELSRLGKTTLAFCGARSAELLPLTLVPGAKIGCAGEPTFCTAEFSASKAASVIATDDGSLGGPGMIGQYFQAWLDRQDPGRVAVYSCGPEPMMRAVGELCVQRGIPCQFALERHMACGMGTCQSCVVKIRDDSPAGWNYKLCCTDGPVFPAERVLW